MISRLIIRLLRLLILLLIVVVITIGAVLFKPIWLSGLIEQELLRYGVQAEIKTLTADFSDNTYQLKADIGAKAEQYGINLPKGKLAVTADWLALFQGKPFITDIKLTQASIDLNRQQLMTAITQYKQAKKSSEHRIDNDKNSPYFLPINWQLTDSTLQAEGQTLSVNAEGQKIDFANIVFKDNTDGILFLHYQHRKHLLSVAGKQIDLKPLTGQPAKLQQLQAVINTDNWLTSRAEGQLNYRGMDSQIQVTGQDEQLLIKASSGGQNVSVIAQPIADNQGVNLHFNQVDLSVFQTIQPLLPAKEELPILQGFIDGIITAYRDQGIISAKLQLNDVGVSHSLGEVNRLSGKVDYQNGIINYQNQLNQSDIALPSVFPEGLSGLNGSLNGRFDVQSKSLILQTVQLNHNAVEKLSASGVIDLDKQSIDMTATVDNVDIAQRRLFLPRQLPKKASQWLGNALLSGKKNHTEFKIRGKFDEIFTDSPHSEFLVKTQLHQTVFHYLDGNPDIFIDKGTLTINKKKLTVNIAQGRLKKTIPIIGKANIDNLTQTVVNVDVKFNPQSLDKLLPIAKKSIAKTSIDTIEKILTAKGKLAMNLHLNLPIGNKKQNNTFKINLSGKSVAVTLKDYPNLPVTNASTDILINEHGLRELTLQGKQGKNPIKIHIKRDKSDNYLTQVNTDAQATSLLKKLALITSGQQQLLSRYHVIGGRSPYQADIIIDKNGKFKQVKVHSKLVGTSVKLFDLIYKTDKTALPLNLIYTASNRQLKIALHKRMDLTLSVTKKGQLAGLLLDNRKTKKPYQKGKIQVYWHSKRLNLAKFNDFRLAWQDISATAKTKKNADKTPAYRYQFDVSIDATRVDDRKKTYPLNINGNLANLSVTSPFITGKMHYKKNDLRADFSTVDLSWLLDFFSKTEITPEGRKVEKISLAKALPQMQVGIEQLIYKGNNIGTANVRTSIQSGHYSIDQLFIQGGLYFFEASGYEAKEPQGITTHLQASFKGERIKELVDLFKLNPVLDGKFIDVSANLSWPGQAHTLNLRQSYGKLKLNAQNVKLTQVSSGMGGVIGLMDIAGILNRISMDFKNLSSSKVFFDTVKGDWNIGGGRAMAKNAYAKGSLIDIKWVGPADLHRRVFDNIKITVIPKASNVIPVIGAVAGGFVGAAIGVVVQQVAGDTMNKAVGLPYRLSGKWTEPILTSGNNAPEKMQKKQADVPTITLESLQ